MAKQNKTKCTLKDFTIIILLVYCILKITARLVTNLPDKHLCFRSDTNFISSSKANSGALKDPTV